MRFTGSLRFRITAWYFFTAAFLLAIFGLGAWFAMRASILRAVDHNLENRIGDVRSFLDEQTSAGRDAVQEELGEQSLLGLGGPMLEVRDQTGALVYRSSRLSGKSIQVGDSEILRFGTLRAGVLFLRAASQRLAVNGHIYMVSVAEPMRQFHQSMEQFETALLISAPLALILASLAGFWMSNRALSPVDRIAREARLISIGNVARRLPVPPARDEIQILAVTLNEMLDRLDAAVKRIVQFTADASHELRAPLALIHAAAEYSVRRERTPAELMTAMQKILRESARMACLVDDLLLLARADSGTDQIHLKPADLAELASHAAGQVEILAERKNIEVCSEIPAAGMVVNGDEQALSRLLLILLDNAVKYTNAGGRITFQLRAADTHVEILVSDTGVGIAAVDLSHIYDRFWRADAVRTRDASGSGLGLSIARWIVERHGGDIMVTSKIGKGSRVCVRLPLLRPRDPIPVWQGAGV